jgi:hypothetical protein
MAGATFHEPRHSVLRDLSPYLFNEGLGGEHPPDGMKPSRSLSDAAGDRPATPTAAPFCHYKRLGGRRLGRAKHPREPRQIGEIPPGPDSPLQECRLSILFAPCYVEVVRQAHADRQVGIAGALRE